MIDKSKVKKTCVRPVNRTMSYEDRRGYVCICIYVKCYTYHSMFRQITPAVTARINFPDYLLDYKDSHYMEFSRNAVRL